MMKKNIFVKKLLKRKFYMKRPINIFVKNSN